MYKSFMSYLRCPSCRSNDLSVLSSKESQDKVYDGTIRCGACEARFPIVDGIPLLVDTAKQGEILSNWSISTEYDKYTLGPTERIKRLISDHSTHAMIALDAGCGSGAYTPFFKSREIICLDLVPFFIKKLMREYKGVSILHVAIADITALPIRDSSVDICVCSSVLEHLSREKASRTVADLFNTCKKVLLVDVPNDSRTPISMIRHALERLGFYPGTIRETTDEKLDHHCRFGVSDLRSMGFDVHGCIGWVSRSSIRLGMLWDLYDYVAWRYPALGGTIIGVRLITDSRDGILE